MASSPPPPPINKPNTKKSSSHQPKQCAHQRIQCELIIYILNYYLCTLDSVSFRPSIYIIVMFSDRPQWFMDGFFLV